MFSPSVIRFRQAFAAAREPAALTFAMPCSLGNTPIQARFAVPAAKLASDCYPSPSLRSGPSRVRPPFYGASRRAFADRREPQGRSRPFVFRTAEIAVFSGHITSPRSSISCVNLSLPSPFWLSPPLAAACRTPRRAVLPVPSSALPQLTRWTKIWLRAQRSAVLQVRQAATSLAAATDLTTAARGRLAVIHGPSERSAPVAFSISASRPGRRQRGERCSTRS
jgi:hypothetical protein